MEFKDMQSNKNRLVILVSILILTMARIVLAGQETLVTGIVTKVRDGDTIEIGGVPIRLKGVSAPELKERFGRASRSFMVNLTLGKPVSCQLSGKKTYDRFVGTCYLANSDIGAEIIKAGLALDCKKFSGGIYKAFETTVGRAQITLPRYCH